MPVQPEGNLATNGISILIPGPSECCGCDELDETIRLHLAL